MSCYCLERNFAFIHIPKNAGTSIRRVMGMDDFDKLDAAYRKKRDPAYANHFPVWKIQELLAQPNWKTLEVASRFDGMRKLMVVRNPWSRMVSLYLHRMRKLNRHYMGKPRNTEEDKAVARKGFIPWLLETPSEGDSVLTTTSQTSWGKNLDGEVVTRHIYHETLETDWAAYCAGMGWPHIGLPKLNVGKPVDYRAFYNPESRRHVEKFFAEDIDRYGYEF